jgi:hypothetical protein
MDAAERVSRNVASQLARVSDPLWELRLIFDKGGGAEPVHGNKETSDRDRDRTPLGPSVQKQVGLSWALLGANPDV